MCSKLAIMQSFIFPLQKYKQPNIYTLKHCLAKFSVNQYSSPIKQYAQITKF